MYLKKASETLLIGIKDLKMNRYTMFMDWKS